MNLFTLFVVTSIIATWSWSLRQKKVTNKLQWFRMLQHVWSQEPRNTSVVFHGCCVVTCTGLPRLFIGVFGIQSFKVPHRLLRASLQSFKLPISPFVRPSQTIYSAVSSQHIWHLGFFSRRSDSLKLTAWFIAWSIIWVGIFMRELKTHLFAGHWDMSALEVSLFQVIALHKSTFTYLLYHIYNT